MLKRGLYMADGAQTPLKLCQSNVHGVVGIKVPMKLLVQM